MQGKCSYCGKSFLVIHVGAYNRSVKSGLNVFCNLRCFGLSRRLNETDEEKKSAKSFYDMFLRVSKTEDELIKESFENAFYFQLDYRSNPDKYKEQRRKRMPKHVEYCRRPEYKQYKINYDKKYRAKKDYGIFWEAAIILIDLEKEIDNRLVKNELGLINKSQKRKRLWQKIQAKQRLNSLLKI